MPDIPKVCVITRTRSRPVLLKRAIESILSQTFTDWQHVIVNDGGDVDELEAVCSTYKKAYAGRLMVMHEKHRGMQQASNTAIEATDSVYLVIHDDDDSWHPDFLKRTTGFLNRKGVKSDYQGVISHTLRILEQEKEDGAFEEVNREPYMPLNEVSLFRVGFENPFPPIAFLYRRKVHQEIGVFDPRWDVAADLDFNFRFLQKFNIGVIPKQLAFYHWRDKGTKGINTNTVTAGQGKHAQYFAELKNHYMRQSGSAEDLGQALSFNIPAFLGDVFVGALKDGLSLVREELWSVIATTRQLQEFNDKALWPKLDGFAEAFQSLGKALASLDKAQANLLENQDQLLQAGADQGTLLKEVDERIKRLGAFQTEALQPKLEALADGSKNIADGLQHLHDEHLKADKEREAILNKGDGIASDIGGLKEQVQQLEARHADELKAALEEILNTLAGELGKLQDELTSVSSENKAANASMGQQLEQIGKFHAEALWPKLEGFAEAVDNLGGAMGQFDKDLLELKDAQTKEMEILGKAREEASADIREKQEAQASQLDAIQEEIVRLREQSRKQWQIGRFRIQWLGKTDDDDSSDSPS
jgi:hypothetical protein